MDSRSDGGPAFPLPTGAGDKAWRQGMSLRDWFAGQALSGFLASDTYSEESAADLAKWSYQQADAMLKAREGK